MYCRPINPEGRSIHGDTPHGVFSIRVRESVSGGSILSPEGRVIGTVDLTIRDPAKSTPTTKTTKRGCSTCGSDPQDPQDPQDTPEHPVPPESTRPNTRRFGWRVTPPGTWLSQLIAVVGFGLIHHCPRCSNRAKALDAAGWRGLPGLVVGAVWSRLRR